MRIGFIGAHGTGKTELAKELLRREEFKNVIFVPSSSRVLANRLNTSKSASPADQLAITLARISDEEIYSDGGRLPILSERTPLDSLAYTTYQDKYVWEGDTEWIVNATEGAVRRAMRDYDIVCYFPAYDWGVKDDGLRDLDPDYQKAVGVYCTMWFNRFGIKPYIMQNESVEKRANNFISWMKRKD